MTTVTELDGTFAEQLEQILLEAQKIAVRYYELTNRPLGITGEMGEYWASKLLRLTLAEARMPGFDAVDSDGRKVQIKARTIKDLKKAGMVGTIKFNYEWDSVLLILLNNDLSPHSMYEASRADILAALNRTSSKARQRGVLSVREFISSKLSQKRWSEF